MKQFAIQANNLTKTFSGGIVAVNGLDLQVERGAVYGLMGRNGSGKTTTLRLLMGLLRPDSGHAKLLGEDMATASRSLRARIAYVSQSLQLPGWMKLSDLCRYVAHFYDRWNEPLATDLARRWALPQDRPVGQFSNGEQRKAAILLALAPQPEVLLLDEPAAGLDPLARRELIDELIGAMAQEEGCTILFSTHSVSDLERVAEYVGIMDRGHLVASERLDELQTQVRRIQVIFPGDSIPDHFSIPGSLRCERAGPVLTAITRVADSESLEALRKKSGVRVQVFPMRLEEIFIELLGRGNREEEIVAATLNLD
jgi:ABC-2 type transport system ATP-binding protein